MLCEAYTCTCIRYIYCSCGEVPVYLTTVARIAFESKHRSLSTNSADAQEKHLCVSTHVYQFHSSYCTRLSIFVHMRSYTTLFCPYRTSASDEPMAAATCSWQPRSALPHQRSGEILTSNCYCRVTVMLPEILLCDGDACSPLRDVITCFRSCVHCKH